MFAGFAATVQARTFTAEVTYVTDGDTIWVKRARANLAIKVRMYGMDAPEICQDYGLTARAVLQDRIMHQTVTLDTKARDVYGRIVAKVIFNGEDIGAWMVANGHAWSYHSRKSLGPYGRQETSARRMGLGLWASGYPMEPKAFRKQTKCKH